MKTRNTTYRPAIRLVLTAAFVLMLPLLAMQVTDQVAWDLADFAIAGALLIGTGFMYKMAARKADTIAYRAAIGVALVAALLLIWINLAVGIIGEPDDLANGMYIGVLAVGIIGALIARLQPHGMARALFATALTHALVAVIAVIIELDAQVSGSLKILILNGLFVALWAGSAWLFRYAAWEQSCDERGMRRTPS